MNLLIGQRVSVKLNNGKLAEGYIDRNKKGEKIVLTKSCWIPFSECKKIVAKGHLVEIGISNEFTSLFAPIDFKKVKSDKDKEDLINSSIDVIKQSNKDASNQTDDELKTIAQDALDKVKSASEIEKGQTTATKVAQEKIKEYELEDEQERDNAIKNAVDLQEKVKQYKINKDKKIAEALEKQGIKMDKETEKRIQESRELVKKAKFEKMLNEAGYNNIESDFEKFVESFQLASGRNYSLEDMYEHVVACVKPDQKLVESVAAIANPADRVVALCEACKKDVYDKTLAQFNEANFGSYVQGVGNKTGGARSVQQLAASVADAILKGTDPDQAIGSIKNDFIAAEKAHLMNSAKVDRSNEMKEAAGAAGAAADQYRSAFTSVLFKKLKTAGANIKDIATKLIKSNFITDVLFGPLVQQVAQSGRI